MNRKKKRVLIIGSDSSVKGGITSVINSFLQNSWENIEIDLLPTYINENPLKKILFFLKFLIKYIVKILKNEFDIIHVHMSYKGSFYRKFIVIKISKIFKKKSVLHLHGSEFEVFYKSSSKHVKKLITDIFMMSDCVIVLGERWLNFIKKIAPEANIQVFNNAVKVPKYTVKYNKECTNILFLGVLIKRKGIYDLIEAINLLNHMDITNKKKVKFIIGGTGKEEEGVRSLIMKYNLNNCIDMVGWVDGTKKEKLLKECNVFVLPSYNEGLPIAILEAISFGIPVISTTVGSIDEAVIHNSNGYLFKPGDIGTLIKYICKILEDDSEWRKFSKESKNIAYSKFNITNYFKKIEEIYNNL